MTMDVYVVDLHQCSYNKREKKTTEKRGKDGVSVMII